MPLEFLIPLILGAILVLVGRKLGYRHGYDDGYLAGYANGMNERIADEERL